MENTNDKAVLNNIYQNAQTGSQGITDLLPKVTNSAFRDDLRQQESSYRAIQQQAAGQLMQMGDTPSEIGTMQKASMWASVAGKTMLNGDTSHLAELMINGSTMGITNMTKTINGYTNPNPQVMGLAQELINLEENSIKKLRGYLQ